MDPLAQLLNRGSGGIPSQVQDAIKAANANAKAIANISGANALQIIAYGQAGLIPSGVTYTPTDVTLDAGLATSFLCFMTRSDLPNNVYPIPYLEATGATGSLQARLLAGANVYQGGIHFYAEAATDYVSAPSLTFYYYMLGMPANATS